MPCVKCQHSQPDHRDDICYGDRFCTCMKYELAEVVKIIKKEYKDGILRSRTDTPLPQPIALHDNWTGKGWEYQKKWGKTQQEMVEFLVHRCGLTVDETRKFLWCKHSSVRGRLSETNRKRRINIGLQYTP